MSAPSEAVLAKAHRYLTEGRVLVALARGNRVVGTVQGSARDPYMVGQSAKGGHWCTCPARTGACAHVVALRLVVGTPDDRRAVLAGDEAEQ